MEWVSVQSGWRDGAVRVMVSAALYGTRAEDMPSDKGWGTELARQAYLEAAEAGTPGGDRRERGELVLHPGGARPRQRALYHPRGGGVWDGGAGADVSGSGAGDLAFGPGRGKNI